MLEPVSPKANKTYLKLQANIPTIKVFFIPYLFKKIGNKRINNASEICPRVITPAAFFIPSSLRNKLAS